MVTPNPATHAQASNPGSDETVVTPPAVTPAPATQAPGINPAGTVIISTEEYARLQRDSARTRSFGKRVYQKPSGQAANIDPNDPTAAAVAQANAERDEALRRAMQSEVRGKVRDLLADDRFKALPKSTKDLILEKPHMLTEAETLEDAMYDIEDKLIEMAGTSNPSNPNPSVLPPNPSSFQPSRETPPIVTPGSPAPVDAGALESTEGLRGSERSMAILRNTIKKQHGGVGATA